MVTRTFARINDCETYDSDETIVQIKNICPVACKFYQSEEVEILSEAIRTPRSPTPMTTPSEGYISNNPNFL